MCIRSTPDWRAGGIAAELGRQATTYNQSATVEPYNLGVGELAVMLLVLGVVIGVPVALIASVVRWIARRDAEQRDLAARVARLESRSDAGPHRAARDREVT